MELYLGLNPKGRLNHDSECASSTTAKCPEKVRVCIGVRSAVKTVWGNDFVLQLHGARDQSVKTRQVLGITHHSIHAHTIYRTQDAMTPSLEERKTCMGRSTDGRRNIGRTYHDPSTACTNRLVVTTDCSNIMRFCKRVCVFPWDSSLERSAIRLKASYIQRIPQQ